MNERERWFKLVYLFSHAEMFFSWFCYGCFPGAREKLINKLSDETQTKITLARSTFRSVSNKFLTGEIQIKTLNQIVQREHEFVDLVKIGEYEYQFFLLFLLKPLSLEFQFLLHLLILPPGGGIRNPEVTQEQ